VKQKAMQILNNSFDQNLSANKNNSLEIIDEQDEQDKASQHPYLNGDRLSKSNLTTLEHQRSQTEDSVTVPDSRSGISSLALNSQFKLASLKDKPKDIFETASKAKNSNFYENSIIDQDDAYGSYKPMFMTKKRAVEGRSD
jgi:hypothetical protein